RSKLIGVPIVVFSFTKSFERLSVYELVTIRPLRNRRSSFTCSALYSDLFSFVRVRDVPVRLNCANCGRPTLPDPYTRLALVSTSITRLTPRLPTYAMSAVSWYGSWR